MMFPLGLALSLLMVQQPSIPPSTVTISKPDATLAELLEAIEQQTRIKVTTQATTKPIDVTLQKTPFWNALQTIANATGSRIALHNQGETIELVERGKGTILADIAGPFRIMVDEVVSRLDVATGQRATDIALTIHWEPTFPVFRISTDPTLKGVKLDTGTTLNVEPNYTHTATLGHTHTTRITLPGIPRDVKKIDTLTGQFRVTAATRMIPFPFKTLSTTKESTVTDSGVTVTLHPTKVIDGRWEFRLVAEYPERMPIFESFESWVTKNRFTLTSPTGKTFKPTDWDIPEQSQRVVAIYRFSAKEIPTLMGWTATYTTPTPLIEFDVPFTLTAIPLP